MDFLAVSERGFEDITLLEVRERCSVDGTATECGVRFSGTMEDAVRLAYRAQSVRRILVFLGAWDFKDDLAPDKATLQSILKAARPLVNESFKVEVERSGKHDFTGMEAAEQLGALIHDGLGIKVDLKRPTSLVFCVIRGDSVAIGVDIAGMDLSKRAYKVFSGAGSLRGTIAYNVLRLAGVSKDSVVIDAHCGSGELAIEVALFMEDVPVRFYEKERFGFQRLPFIPEEIVKKVFSEEKNPGKGEVTAFDSRFPSIVAAKKNAKIAGVQDVRFSRCDLEWLDTKLDKGSADFIIVRPIEAGKRVAEREQAKFVKELLYQASYVLKTKGKLVVLSRVPLDLDGWKLVDEREVSQGAEKFSFKVWIRD